MKDRILSALRHVVVVGAAGTAIGYMIGALIGIGMTWHNNNVLVGTPHGSYLFWANFMGFLIAAFTSPVSLLIGLAVGLSRTVDAAQSEHGVK